MKRFSAFDFGKPEPSVEITSVELQAFQFAVQEEMPDVQLRNVQVESFRDQIARRMAWRLRASLYGEQLQQQTVTYPKNATQVLKQGIIRFFAAGAWPWAGHWPWLADYISRRWPVEYTTITLNARALYPKLSLPHESHVVHIARTDGTQKPVGDWVDMQQDTRPLFEVLRAVLYRAEQQYTHPYRWVVGAKAYHEMLKMPELGMAAVYRSVQEPFQTMLFGMSLGRDALVPADVIELRDRRDKVVGKIYNVGAA